MCRHIKQPDFHPICTPSFVREFVEYIGKISDDDERAHAAEDSLYMYIIQSIAKGEIEQPKICCKEALLTENFDFARWCA